MIRLATLSTIVGRALAAAKRHDTAHKQAALTPDDLGDVTPARIYDRHMRGGFSSGSESTGIPDSVWLRRRRSRPSLPAEVSMVHTSRAGCFLGVGLILACVACHKEPPTVEKNCSTQTKCSAGYKCEKEDGSPVSGPLDVGKCKEDPCAVTVPCETPQHATHPKEPCVNDLVEMCDVHHPNSFCKCQSTLPNQGVVTTGNTPTTG